MWHNYQFFTFLTPGTRILLALVVIWSVIWKGIALWKSARNSHKIWFVALLLINTAGILEIIYILFFGKKQLSQKTNGQN